MYLYTYVHLIITQAKVCEVTGRLQYTSDDLQWSLSVIITDGSHEQLSARLSNEVQCMYMYTLYMYYVHMYVCMYVCTYV